MRSLALDVHQSFCEVAICEEGEVRSAGRVKSERAALELFAASLAPTDQVVMEATGPAMEIARILEPHVARVVVANAQDVRAISHARVKSDRFDARTLARLLDAGMLEAVWVPDAETQELRRRVARRAALVRQRTRAKNEIHATLARCLLGRAPVSDLFGKGGRAWLARQELPASEAETVTGCLRQIDFLSEEIGAIDAKLCEWVSASPEARRLMTIPGVGVAAAAALMAAIGDVSRFSSPRKLVAYLGLDAKVRQSGEGAARHGRISKRGNTQARAVLVEAAWIAARSPGPLRAFAERLRARKHSGVASVALARKIACLCWQLLSKEEDYAFARPSLVRAKLRKAELAAGAPPLPKRHSSRRVSASKQEREAERELVERAEATYKRLVADWASTGAKGAGVTRGRASSGPSTGQAARQASAPGPAL
jgi:transposase